MVDTPLGVALSLWFGAVAFAVVFGIPSALDAIRRRRQDRRSQGGLDYVQILRAQHQQGPLASSYAAHTAQAARLGARNSPTPEPAPTGPLPAAKVSAPVVGVRSWTLVRRDGELRLLSTNTPLLWDGPIMRNEGPPTETWTPALAGLTEAEWRSAAGFFAFKPHVTADRLSNAKVWGEVELMGGVIEHELGYRAQIIRIRCLTVRRPEDTAAMWITCEEIQRLVKELGDFYSCPVHLVLNRHLYVPTVLLDPLNP